MPSKNYAIRLEDATIVSAIENVLIKLCNLQNLNYVEAVKAMFLKGFETYAVMPDTAISDPEDKVNIELYKELDKIQLEKNRENNLVRLLESRGQDYFIEWCKQHGIAYEPIISNCEEIKNRDAANESVKMGVWLEKELGDMLPHKYSDIVENALMEGILPDSIQYPQQYSTKLKTLSNIASSRGYSSRDRRGVWQKMMR